MKGRENNKEGGGSYYGGQGGEGKERSWLL